MLVGEKPGVYAFLAIDRIPDEEKNLKTGQCIKSGNDVVHHDAEAAVDALVEPGDRKGLEYIKQAEKDKSKDPGDRMVRHCDKGNEHAKKFIDNNWSGISQIKDFFSGTCQQTADNKHNA